MATIFDTIKSALSSRQKGAGTAGLASMLGMIWGTAAPDLYASKRVAAYKSWVSACVSAIADDVADTEWHLEKKKRDGTWERVEHEAMAPINNRANILQSGYDLIFATAAYLKLDGNSFWWVVKNRGGKIAELWPLDPSKIVVKTNDNGEVTQYEMPSSVSGKTRILKTDEIVHFKTFNPLNAYRGMGTVEQVALAIDTDEYASRWNKNFFANSAVPSAALQTEAELTKDQAKIIEEAWNEKHRGTDSAHKLAILHSGLKYTPTNPSQKDMEFLEQRKFSRDEILAIFRVPKMILGIVEDVNRSNAEASDYIFAKRVIKPLIQMVANTMTSKYLPLWKLDPNEYRVWFDDPVPENRELVIKEDESGIRNGYVTINEVRAKRGMPALDGGDVPLIQSGMIPLDEASLATGRTPGTSSSGSEGSDAGAKTKEVQVKGANRRVRFIKNRIKAKTEVYKQHLLSHKSEIVKAVKRELKEVKSLKAIVATKDKTNAVVNTIFAEIEPGWIEEIDATNQATYKEVMKESGTQALKQVSVNGAFDLENPRAVDWMTDNGLTAATSVVGTIKEEVRARIAAGIKEGLSVDEIAAKVSQFFDQVNWRALRIARTEVIGSYAQGSLEGYRQSGVVKGKRWMIIEDDRVDPECVANAEQGTIPLESTFSSGQSVPPVHPNCRCSVQPVVD